LPDNHRCRRLVREVIGSVHRDQLEAALAKQVVSNDLHTEVACEATRVLDQHNLCAVPEALTHVLGIVYRTISGHVLEKARLTRAVRPAQSR
jgi:hypothetical protein